MSHIVNIRVPATTANIGPGFDCLGLSLDLWNEIEFSTTGNGLDIKINGEGNEQLPRDSGNLIYNSYCRVFKQVEKNRPAGLRITCRNNIPLSSGLGSSAAATLTGVLGANSLLGNPLNDKEIIQLCTEIEGHPDNISPAYFGGLTVSVMNNEKILTQKISIPEWHIVVILPECNLSTENARKVIPENISIQDAVYNIGRTALIIEGLRTGNLSLLAEAMDDRLHQPYRLSSIPGGGEAISAAKAIGAAAALSGAGPSVVAFTQGEDIQIVIDVMKKAFEGRRIKSREFILSTTSLGAQIR